MRGLRAGFAEVDISPPPGTHKIGWLREIIGDRVLDPLYARIGVFEQGDVRLAFIQLDTLSIRWTQTNDIRRRVERRYGYPGTGVMVAATHNHCGPAVSGLGGIREEGYIETMVAKIEEAFGRAVEGMGDVEAGFGRVYEWNLGHNRRVVLRDGTVCTHGNFGDPQALYIEGPVDPEVSVLAVRGKGDEARRGCLVNFTCHPTHLGGGTDFTAGFPGVAANMLKAEGYPVPLFLNGACGNVHTSDPARGGEGPDMEQAGRILAGAVERAGQGLSHDLEARLACALKTVELPCRRITDEEVRGTVRGAQRFVDPAIYDREMPRLTERIRTQIVQRADVQALSFGPVAYVGIPAEYFVELGLRIKEETWPRHTVVVGHANGMVGYIPTRDAFRRGGYETTFGGGSRLAPEAGDILADAAIALVRGLPS